jgi:hypothetical protein
MTYENHDHALDGLNNYDEQSGPEEDDIREYPSQPIVETEPNQVLDVQRIYNELSEELFFHWNFKMGLLEWFYSNPNKDFAQEILDLTAYLKNKRESIGRTQFDIPLDAT